MKELRWQPGANLSALEERAGWTVNGDLVREAGAQTTVAVSPLEMVIVGLWAASCAALWLSAQDSKPLLQLVGKLDPHVYVL
jgi:hypothetical protein